MKSCEMCDNYLLSYRKERLIEILKDPDDSKHLAVELSFLELSGNEPNLANVFLENPEESLQEWNKAIQKVQTNLILQSEEDYVFKKLAHCRIHSLPVCPELHRTTFPQHDDDINKFLQISGTVVRRTGVKMMEYQRQYICTKCKYLMVACAEYETKNRITPPRKCGNPVDCRGTNIIRMGELNPEFCKDYQEIKIQEIRSKRDAWSMPLSMWVTLEDDLVDSCQPGANVVVCGFIKIRHDPFEVGKSTECELVIKANHLQVNNNSSARLITPELTTMFDAFWKTYSDTPLAARDMILKSICPELFGLSVLKLAMAVVLAGGSNLPNNSKTGVRIRTEPHLLLVGDPGTGKSELLRFASKIIPRAVLTTGVGSTAAGLTCAALMENGEWQLEGGALVLSDGGICCIDEFNTIKETDRTSIHEAMEQQTISVAKAGIVSKLSTRCSVLAATNPKGKLLDVSQPITMNVALASPLLSRFDLILLIRDTYDEQWDNQMTDYILKSLPNSNSSKLDEGVNWTIETLQAYFAVIKKNHPRLTEDANRILSNYYQAQRMKNDRNKSRTTVRLLDSLARLSQGHARLMFHGEVEILDAVIAVILVETSMEADSSVFRLSFDLRVDFPQDPTANYKELMQIVLKKLGLNDLLEKELDRMDNKKPSDRPGPSGANDNNPSIVKNKTPNDGENNVQKRESSGINKIEDTKSDINICEKENKISEVNTEKLENKKEVNEDLAALRCMPSVNDVFRMDDSEIGDDSIGLNFEEMTSSKKDKQITKKFDFKKFVLDKNATSLATSRDVVADSVPVSIFESQEDVDFNLD